VQLKDEVQAALRTAFDYEDARMQTLPGKFACLSVVQRQGDTNFGVVDPAHPWGDPVAES
jgi:gamma-glutamyltranspeptidase/glutathione hydrolase